MREQECDRFWKPWVVEEPGGKEEERERILLGGHCGKLCMGTCRFGWYAHGHRNPKETNDRHEKYLSTNSKECRERERERERQKEGLRGIYTSSLSFA